MFQPAHARAARAPPDRARLMIIETQAFCKRRDFAGLRSSASRWFARPFCWDPAESGILAGRPAATGRACGGPSDNRDRATGVEPPQEALPRRNRRFGADTGLFFLLFYLYVWRVIDPRLIHHGLGVLTPYHSFSFSTGWPFFGEHLARPGGLARYAARLLSQLYGVGWAGALVVTVAALSMCLATDVLTRLAGRPRGMVVRYVPAVLLLVLIGGYAHPLSTMLSLLGSLGCFLLYLRWASPGTTKRLALVPVACAGLYYVVGAGSLLFAVLVAIYELLVVRRALVGLAAVLCGLGVAWIAGETLYALGVDEDYGGFLLFGSGVWCRFGWAVALCLFFPVVLAGAAAWRGLLARWAPRAADRPSPETGSPDVAAGCRLPGRGVPRRAVAMAVVLLGAGAAAWYAFDAPARTTLQIDYHSLHENWTEVLRAADRMPYGKRSVRSNRNVVLALYHTGRLGDRMFHYPQTRGVDLFATPATDWDAGSYFQESRLLFELGHVNLAEKWAYEALETSGPLPELLEHLATIHVVKDRPETARILLNALGKNPLHRGTAREMLRRLDEDPRLADDPRISAIRRSMLTRDTFVSPQTPVEDIFLVLLERNPGNRMAFEVLMAFYLCNHRLDRAVANLRRLEAMEYREIPRHYQEAIVIGSSDAGREPAFAGYRLDPEVVERGRQFAELMATSTSPEQLADRALAAGFGDTYFFYYLFAASGL